MNLLEQKQESCSDMEERQHYLDESIDKVQEDINESNDKYDINPSDNDIGESSRSASGKLLHLRKRISVDRMTPEFKLHNKDDSLLIRDVKINEEDLDELFKGLPLNSKFITQFNEEND